MNAFFPRNGRLAPRGCNINVNGCLTVAVATCAGGEPVYGFPGFTPVFRRVSYRAVNFPAAMATILIVDCDAVQRGRMARVAEELGHRAVVAESLARARSLLAVAAPRQPHPPSGPAIDVVIADAAMQGGEGAVAGLAARHGAPPVIAAVAPGAADAVARLMRAGAADFLVKPVSPERLAVSIANALRMQALRLQVMRMDVLRAQAPVQGAGGRHASLAGFVADDPAMERALSVAARAARAPGLPVLIEGEAGSGRETIARLIHAGVAGAEERRARPFTVLRCAVATPASLEQGLFAARVREAQGGTLYLDDVDALPASLQAEAMRLVNDVEERPRRGSRAEARADVRVIAAARASLLDAVRRSAFREDLFYRFSVLPITLPPLRARHGDIGALALVFLARFAAAEGKAVHDIAPDALALLRGYAWPGNVAELENAMFRAVVLAEGERITVADLPQIAARMTAGHALPVRAEVFAGAAFDDAGMRAIDPDAVTLVDGDGDMRSLESLEADIIRFAVRRYRGRMSEVSRRLGIGRSTLYRKLKSVGLEGAVDGGTEEDFVMSGRQPGVDADREDSQIAV